MGIRVEKAIIYLRTSTKDQNPELQREDCIRFCAEKSLEVVEIVSEQGSAYKLEKVRPKWEGVVKRAKKEKLDIVVWRYDRSFRNREEFYKFMKIMFEVYKKRVFSVKETSIMDFWNMMDTTKIDNPVFSELMKNLLQALWNFMIKQAGEEAEEESRKKSERVKMAAKKICPKCKKQNKMDIKICEKCGENIENIKTKSYKGNKWGRKTINVDKKIAAAYETGKNMREIAKEVFYWDKNNHKKFVSLGLVHKILSRLKEENKLSNHKAIKDSINEQK